MVLKRERHTLSAKEKNDIKNKSILIFLALTVRTLKHLGFNTLVAVINTAFVVFIPEFNFKLFDNIGTGDIRHVGAEQHGTDITGVGDGDAAPIFFFGRA